MAAGAFRTPVTFQSISATLDAARQPIETFSTLVRVGANVVTLAGRTSVNAGLESNDTGIQVDARYTPTIAALNSSNRMVIGGTQYEIMSVSPSFQNDAVRIVGRAVR